jgi:uncharacterized small protein (DUF1192 family)
MALKRKITKAEFDALNDVLKAEYKVSGSDYVLDADDAADAISARDKERKRADDLKAEVDRLKAEQTEKDTERSRKEGDFKAVEDSYKKKLADKDTKHETELGTLKGALEKVLVDGVAQSMAAELAGDNGKILVPHIKSRLKAEYTDDGPLTRVLGSDGKLTANSVEDLKQEFKKDKAFSNVIIQTRASGTSGTNGGGSGSALPLNKPFKDMNDVERTELFKRDPDTFKRATQEEVARVRGI